MRALATQILPRNTATFAMCGLVTMLSFLGGCAVTNERGGEDLSDELYVARSKIWRRLQIPVCWEGEITDTTAKNWVQTSVQSTWEASSRLRFTGWSNCVTNAPGIHIRVADENPHTRGLGQELNGVTGGMVLNFTFANFSREYCSSRREECIRSVAVHEFGHALGFAHEQNRSDRPSSCRDAPQGSNGDALVGPFDWDSVMNYCNPEWNNGGQLSNGDLLGLRAYYGHPQGASLRRAAFDLGNGKFYFFRGSEYTRYDIAADRADSGYPKPIAGNWPGFPSSWTDGVDAIVRLPSGKVYFFRGNEYARYNTGLSRFDAGYPKPIAGNWPGLPTSWSNIDAVARFSDGKLYFFRGDEYVRYDVTRDQADPGYPRSASLDFPGAYSTSLHGVLVYPSSSRLYFLGDTTYTRFDFANRRVDTGFPRDIVGYWSGALF